MPEFRISDRAFKDLVLYIAAQLQDDPAFGETKLNKALFFGEPITGAEYQRNYHGPTARIFTILRDQMIRDGEIETENRLIGGYRQVSIQPLREPETEFTPEQREIIDAVLNELRKYTNAQVSDESHKHAAGWRAMEQGNSIPYSSAIIDPTELTEEQLQRLREHIGLAA